MGKRKLEKIERIENDNTRKVTYGKRKKGLLKKAIELSKLCDQEIFIFIHDKEKQRMVHYASNESNNLLNVFNQKLFREFYSNKDYELLGGQHDASDVQDSEEANKETTALQNLQPINQFLTKLNKKYILKTEMSIHAHQQKYSFNATDQCFNGETLQTSLIGSLEDQKMHLLDSQKQVLKLYKTQET